MTDFYDRVYPDDIASYSSSNTVTEKDIIVATTRSLMEKIESTNKRDGKFKYIRELFEFQLKTEQFFRTYKIFRRTVMDKCTELIEGVMDEECLHPDDKKGLISVFSAVMRLCMKTD